jgi:hypothetical protein
MMTIAREIFLKMKTDYTRKLTPEGFCCRGCYQSFYLHRCRVCEGDLPKVDGKGRPRVICKKAKCKNAWAAGEGFGKYVESTGSYPVSKNPEKCAGNAPKAVTFERAKAGPGWRIVAGGPLTTSQLHAATVPDGPDCSGRTVITSERELKTAGYGTILGRYRSRGQSPGRRSVAQSLFGMRPGPRPNRPG